MCTFVPFFEILKTQIQQIKIFSKNYEYEYLNVQKRNEESLTNGELYRKLICRHSKHHALMAFYDDFLSSSHYQQRNRVKHRCNRNFFTDRKIFYKFHIYVGGRFKH